MICLNWFDACNNTKNYKEIKKKVLKLFNFLPDNNMKKLFNFLPDNNMMKSKRCWGKRVKREKINKHGIDIKQFVLISLDIVQLLQPLQPRLHALPSHLFYFSK